VKRLHLHVAIGSLPDGIRFYSDLFDIAPCCSGKKFASWRVDQPPLNLTASVTERPTGLAHLGLEVEDSVQLLARDRLLHGDVTASAGVPWEVSVRKHPVQKERRS